MEFLDPSKGMVGGVPADTPIHTASWVVTTLRDYVFKGTRGYTQRTRKWCECGCRSSWSERRKTSTTLWRPIDAPNSKI